MTTDPAEYEPSRRAYHPHGPADYDARRATLDALATWIAQRPGLDPRDYIRGSQDRAGLAAYRSDARSITRDLRAARAGIAAVERSGIPATELHDAFRDAYAERLSVVVSPKPDGGYRVRLEYTTGQYWPTEYRAAAAAVLARALWTYYAPAYKDGRSLRAALSRLVPELRRFWR